ncbi:MAG TPA: NAD(P)/FAD-dependent oxidoreductase [Actinomycetota bacterium]|nr:NAD(P)/FAD-dependent oxidoreductase [Actinomycetota bacterium]
MERFDAFVVGGGGTGSEIAFRLAGAGLRVGLAERDRLGGECNHYGCVPTKVMLRSAKIAHLARGGAAFGVRIPQVEVDVEAVRRRARDIIQSQSGGGAEPFERAGIRVFMQEARLTGPRRLELADGARIEARAVVLATGSEPTLPPVEGLRDGPVWTNKEAIWACGSVPGSLGVIGTGAIGIEFAQIYARFGSRVAALEVMPRIMPSEDEEVSAALAPALEEEGIRLRPGVHLERALHDGRRWILEMAGGERLQVDELLVAAGRRACFDGHDLDAAGVRLDEGGRPLLDATLRTTAEGIWAAGDATGELLFTHVGTYEAEIVADDILGRPRPRDYHVVPRVTFCDPEVASVGLSEREARERGHEVRTGRFLMRDSERAQIEGRTDGLVKIVADPRTGQVLGGHIVAEEAGAMIHEVVAAMAARVPVEAIGRAIHAYPTLSESVKAAFARLLEG